MLKVRHIPGIAGEVNAAAQYERALCGVVVPVAELLEPDDSPKTRVCSRCSSVRVDRFDAITVRAAGLSPEDIRYAAQLLNATQLHARRVHVSCKKVAKVLMEAAMCVAPTEAQHRERVRASRKPMCSECKTRHAVKNACPKIRKE